MSAIHKLNEFGIDIQLKSVEDVASEVDNKLEVNVINMDNNCLEFEIVNADCSLVNSLRRIFLSEVPTMAIEKVLVLNNTSVIQDEALAARLGLIPIRVDPEGFSYHKGPEAEAHEEDTLVFELKIKCSSPQNSSQLDEGFTIVSGNVYSKHLKWVPVGNQSEKFSENPPHCPFPDILIAKLSPGQILDLTLHCHKGIGQDHAKFSPVATAFYRLKPHIRLKEPILDDRAIKLKSYFSEGVIELVKRKDGRVEAKVKDVHKDIMSYNVIRDKELSKSIEIGRVPNHYIFKIESSGALPPEVIFRRGIKILIEKCEYFLNELKDLVLA